MREEYLALITRGLPDNAFHYKKAVSPERRPFSVGSQARLGVH